MSQRVFLDRALVVNFPLQLNATQLLALSGNKTGSQRAQFRTDLIVHYVPEVGANTPGQVMLGFATRPLTRDKDILACSPLRISPAWRPCALRIPKSLLQRARWTDEDEACPHLCAVGMRGQVTITCTLICLNTSTLIPPPPPALSDLSTRCYVGPQLVGFSLCACMPQNIQPQWNGRGLCLNVSFLNGLETVKSSRYIASPKTGKLIAVRYGFGSNFNYTYNTANKGRTWKSAFGATIHDVTNNPGDSSSTAVQYNYGGSWTIIDGDTSWWAEINPTSYTGVLGGMTITWYYPCCQLILYYDYGDVDVVSSEFWPGITIDPETCQPAPPQGWTDPAVDVELPLNSLRTTLLIPPQWTIADKQIHGTKPTVLKNLETGKETLIDWPTVRWQELRSATQEIAPKDNTADPESPGVADMR